jgi:sporulation protein YlmC with PRC-barrel domain
MTQQKAAAVTGEISAEDLLNKSVKNAAGESVGDINDLRIKGGKVIAAIVGVGGFLGLGEKDVALPYDQLRFARDADGNFVVTADVTKESLQAAPAWKKPGDSY